MVKIRESAGRPFMMLENINFFLDACKNKLQVPDYRVRNHTDLARKCLTVFFIKLFLPLDLLERKNMPRVIYCLHQFANLMFEKYGLGLKIVEKTGQFQFSQEEIEKAQRDLEEYELDKTSGAAPSHTNDAELEKERQRALEEAIRLRKCLFATTKKHCF